MQAVRPEWSDIRDTPPVITRDPFRWRTQGGQVLEVEGPQPPTENVPLFSDLKQPLRIQRLLIIIWGMLALYPYVEHIRAANEKCPCNNGLPAKGVSCPHHYVGSEENFCLECFPGYTLRVDEERSMYLDGPFGTCDKNHCRCKNGESREGVGCPETGFFRCKSCKAGYVLVYDLVCCEGSEECDADITSGDWETRSFLSNISSNESQIVAGSGFLSNFSSKESPIVAGDGSDV